MKNIFMFCRRAHNRKGTHGWGGRSGDSRGPGGSDPASSLTNVQCGRGVDVVALVENEQLLLLSGKSLFLGNLIENHERRCDYNCGLHNRCLISAASQTNIQS